MVKTRFRPGSTKRVFTVARFVAKNYSAMHALGMDVALCFTLANEVWPKSFAPEKTHIYTNYKLFPVARKNNYL